MAHVLIIFLILLLFSPYLCLLYLLYDVHKKGNAKASDCVAMLFILAIIGIYWFPWGDPQSHFAYYYSDIVELYYNDYSLKSTYWFYDLVISKIANSTGNYVWGYFFWLFIPVLIFYYGIKINIIDKLMNYQMLLYLLLFLGIREYLDLNRCVSAFLLFAASALFLLKKNYWLCALCLIASLLLHDTVRTYLLVIPLGFAINRLSTRKINILYALTAISSIAVLNIILPLVLSERNLSIYFGDGWESNKGVDSGFMYLLGIINLLIFIVQFILIQSNRQKINKLLYILFLSSSFVAMCGFSMWVLRERFIIFSNVIAASIILINWNNLACAYNKHFTKKQVLRYLNLFFVSRIMLHLMLIYSSHFIHNSATTNNVAEFKIVSHSLYLPTIFLLDIDSYGFSDKAYHMLYDRVKNSIE